jgi:putative methyltransferase (TIGR04325 family)
MLRIIDFGGSLGSSYYQNIGFLKHLNRLSWNVVEQNNFVERGKKLFTNDHLHFYSSIEDCLKEQPCEVILFASVLPYLKAPYDLLNQVVSKEFKYIIIDRTPMLEEKNDRLTVQHVPDEIYRASYPAWFFSREKLIDFFMPHYELVSEFDSLVPKIKLANTTAFEKGFVFKKRD